ncbi:MAG: transglutaminase domain-containing protein, partial [Bdellovibrionales bacterium]|nr:transglutaminase domain-containing protein [Bdellovibrionales bacterium]
MRPLLALELLGLTALLTSGEVTWHIFLLLPLALRPFRWALPPRGVLLLLMAVVVAALSVWVVKRTPPILLAAYGAAFFHGILWASAVSYRYWRAGLAFLDLLIGASLSPGVHHFALAVVFLFVALSLGIRLQMESDARAHGGVAPEFRWPGVFFSLASLAAAAAIFPLLPRANWGFITDPRRVDVGYTEEVRTSDWNLGVLQDNPRILLRFSWPRSSAEAGRWRLIRGKVLEKFDGIRWRPAVKYPAVTEEAEGLPVLAIREAIGSDILPVPYGAAALELDGARSRRQATGEWVESNPSRRRAEYRFVLPERRSTLNDPPREVHREAYGGSAEWKALVGRLARGATVPEAKARAVAVFLSRGFRAELGRSQAGSVEDFLFRTRAGRCEAFATAAALLLRNMGVPTRLVVGFRPGRAPRDGLLEVKGRDSHAWLEFWNGAEWQEMDPTPLVLVGESPFSEFEDVWDQVNSLWYRWVLDFDPRGIRARDLVLRSLLPASVVGLLGFLLWAAFRVSFRGRSVRERLRAERDRFDREVGAHEGWMACYLELRFGARNPEE